MSENNQYVNTVNESLKHLLHEMEQTKIENKRFRNLLAGQLLTAENLQIERDRYWTDNQHLRTQLVEIRRLSDPDYEGHKLMTDALRLENVHIHALISLGVKKESIDGHLETQHIDEFLAAPKKVKNTAVMRGWVWMHDHLFGNVYNHPDFKDGTAIHSSTVLKMNDAKTLAETGNTIYTLENQV